MANFEKIFKEQIILDLGSSEHEKYGFTETSAKNLGYDGDFRLFSIQDAKTLYKVHYWAPFNFEDIQNSKMAMELFEFTRHTRNGELAVRIMQRSFNVLNKNILLNEDGVLGVDTQKAVNTYKFYKSLFKTMNIIQGMYHIFEAEGDVVSSNLMNSHKTSSSSCVDKNFVRDWIDKIIK